MKHDEAVGQIRSAYTKFKARPLPAVVLPEEPKQTAPREVIEEAPIELGYFYFAWHIPELRHPDVPVLDVLAALLGSGRSSRLYQEVRENKGLVNSVDAWTYSPGNPGLLGLSATVDADKFAVACDAMLAEVEKMQVTLVSAEELSKAVKQFVSATLSARKTMQGQAQDLGGSWLAANDLNFSERYLAAVKRVTPADVQRVAREYLSPEHRTLYALLPTGATPKGAIESETPQDHPVQKFDLANGLRLLVKEDHRLPFVEFRAVFQGGVLVETPDNNGLTQLTGKLLLKGTERRSAEDIAREIESVGGSIDSYGGEQQLRRECRGPERRFRHRPGLAGRCSIEPYLPRPGAGTRAAGAIGHHPRAKGPPAPERRFGHAPGVVRRARVRPRCARHRAQRPEDPGCRCGRFPHQVRAPQQLRAGDLRRHQCRRGQERGGESLRFLASRRTPDFRP